MFESVSTFVGIFIAMVAVTLLLRRRGIISSSSKPALTSVLMDIICPSLIFSSLAKAQPDSQQLHAAGVVFGVELINAAIAYLIARYVLRLHRSALGVFIIAATFGSTSLIGTSMVQILFNNDADFIALGIKISQFGVGLPLNTIGVLLAIHFGDPATNISVGQHIRNTLSSPFMIALYAGIGWFSLDLPTTGIGPDILFGTCKMIGASLTFCVAMVVGLSLENVDFRSDAKIVIAASAICLVIEPLLVLSLTHTLNFDMHTRILTNLFAAMPATPIVVAYALKYGGDVGLAGKLAVSTLILSTVTLPLVALIA